MPSKHGQFFSSAHGHGIRSRHGFRDTDRLSTPAQPWTYVLFLITDTGLVAPTFPPSQGSTGYYYVQDDEYWHDGTYVVIKEGDAAPGWFREVNEYNDWVRLHGGLGNLSGITGVGRFGGGVPRSDISWHMFLMDLDVSEDLDPRFDRIKPDGEEIPNGWKFSRLARDMPGNALISKYMGALTQEQREGNIHVVVYRNWTMTHGGIDPSPFYDVAMENLRITVRLDQGIPIGEPAPLHDTGDTGWHAQQWLKSGLEFFFDGDPDPNF